MAKLDGKNTVYMEKQKQYWLLKTAAARLEAIKQKMIAARLSGDLDEEEILALRKSYNEQREVVKDSMHQIEVIDKTEANRKKDEAKKVSDENSKNAKSNADKQKEINAKKVEAEKKYQWKTEKINENLEAEILDVILCESVNIHPKKNIFEINTTDKSIDDVASSIMEIIRNKFKPMKKYNIGYIDWSEEVLKDF
jgi:hypothetical protein